MPILKPINPQVQNPDGTKLNVKANKPRNVFSPIEPKTFSTNVFKPRVKKF